MSFAELISKRRSVRSYRPDPVENEKIEKIIESALMAPTACNNQPFFIIVRKGTEEMSGLKPVYDREWFYTAPAAVMVCCDLSTAWVRSHDGKNYGEVDAAIVMDHLILSATELGLGTCWIAAFDPFEAKRVFGLPEHIVPVVMTPLGYPAQKPKPIPRKKIEEVVRRIKF